MKTPYHHRNSSAGLYRNGAPADDVKVSTSGEIITRELSDEEWEQAIARVHLRRARYNGRTVYEEPTKSEGDETPHGII